MGKGIRGMADGTLEVGIYVHVVIDWNKTPHHMVVEILQAVWTTVLSNPRSFEKARSRLQSCAWDIVENLDW